MQNEIDSHRLEALFGFVSECARLRDYDPLLRLLSQRGHWLIDFDRLTILLYDDHRQVLRTIVIEEHSLRDVSSDDIQLSEIGSIFETLKTGTSSGGAIRVCTPLISAGFPNGVLCFAKTSGEYTSSEVQLVEF